MGILGAIFARLGLAGTVAIGLALALVVQTLRLDHAKADLTRLRASEQAAADHAKVVAKQAAAISSDASAKNQAAQVQIQTVTRTLIKRLPAHVAPSDPGFYPWPAWGVRSYNASLGLPDVPDPAGRPDAASSGLGAADALPTVISNVGACREDQARLAGLQGWVRAQAANR